MRVVLSTFLATILTVAAVAAAADRPTVAAVAPASADVTGQWSGTWAYQHPEQGAGTMASTFEQNGEKLSGSLTLYGVISRPYTVIGFVRGNQITLSQPTIGNLTINGDQITGVLDGWDNARITLRRQ